MKASGSALRRISITARLFALITESRYPVKVLFNTTICLESWLIRLGGWDRLTEEYPEDLGTEIDQAFDNVEHALKHAGGTGLDQVYKLRIYITQPLDGYFEALVRNLKGRPGFKNHGPLLTVVQVVALYQIMRIEIEAEAYLG
jgi:enamine deaminase RidA (YjgF/YER057c/UK114 family)